MAEKQVKHYTISIRKGDTVQVMAGRDVGKTGRVLSVNPRKNTVIVEHTQLIKRHTRPNPSKNIKGGIVEREGPINVSNVSIVCTNCNKHSRIGNNVLPDGTKVRVCKRCGTALDK